MRASFEGCSSSLGGIGYPGIGHFLTGCCLQPLGPQPLIIGVGAGAHVTAGFPEKKTGQFPASLPPFSAQRKEVPARHERIKTYAAIEACPAAVLFAAEDKKADHEGALRYVRASTTPVICKKWFHAHPPFFTQRKGERSAGDPPESPRVVGRLS